MNRLITLLLSLSIISATTLYAQEELLEKWDEDVIAEANTVKDADYLTKKEKEVIVFCNLARLDGKLFAETYVEYYLDLMGKKQTGNVKSLIKDLNKLEKLEVFKPTEELFEIAKGHAKKSGKTGHVGHKDFDDRYKKALESYNTVGENCYYGSGDALEIVMTLLIDEGVPNLGHRKNIFNVSFNSIGVSVQPHKDYGDNCVMSFGRITKKPGGYGIID